jgi:hypothetical protein
MDGVRSLISCSVVVAVLAAGAGCRLTPSPGLMACPLPPSEQVERVLKVTPLGTPRDEVVKQLELAGVAGNFSEGKSIYYCDIWDQKDGSRWHINVALLFDEDGVLYATRPDLAGRASETDDAEVRPAGQIAPPPGYPGTGDPFQGS